MEPWHQYVYRDHRGMILSEEGQRARYALMRRMVDLNPFGDVAFAPVQDTAPLRCVHCPHANIYHRYEYPNIVKAQLIEQPKAQFVGMHSGQNRMLM